MSKEKKLILVVLMVTLLALFLASISQLIESDGDEVSKEANASEMTAKKTEKAVLKEEENCPIQEKEVQLLGLESLGSRIVAGAISSSAHFEQEFDCKPVPKKEGYYGFPLCRTEDGTEYFCEEGKECFVFKRPDMDFPVGPLVWIKIKRRRSRPDVLRVEWVICHKKTERRRLNRAHLCVTENQVFIVPTQEQLKIRAGLEDRTKNIRKYRIQTVELELPPDLITKIYNTQPP